MAAIDYWDIETSIVSTIQTAVGSGVVVNAEVQQPMDTRPWVAVYLEDRTAPEDQPIAAGKRQRYDLKFSIWCWCWSLDGRQTAAEARDDLMGTVESALMGNRHIGGKIQNGTLQGGSFETAKDEHGLYIAGGEIVFISTVTATV